MNIKKINRIKLAKALMHFGEVKREDGTSISFEGDLTEGVELFVEVEGEISPIEDGEYTLDDGRILVAKDGLLAEIKDKVEEAAPEEEVVEEAMEEELPIEEPAEEVIDETEALKEKIAELEEIIKEKDAEIERLKGEAEEALRKVAASVEKPVKDDFASIAQFKSLNYFK